ncbi:hypothetical protein Gotur_024037 [Gossypium turneri]
MGVSNMNTWLICLALIGIVVMEEVIQIDAAIAIHHPEVSGLVSYRRLLQEAVNPWNHGCSKLTRMGVLVWWLSGELRRKRSKVRTPACANGIYFCCLCRVGVRGVEFIEGLFIARQRSEDGEFLLLDIRYRCAREFLDVKIEAGV